MPRPNALDAAARDARQADEAKVAAFLDALGPSSAPAPAVLPPGRPVPAVPNWRSAGSQPAGLPAAAVAYFGYTDEQLDDFDQLAIHYARYGDL